MSAFSFRLPAKFAAHGNLDNGPRWIPRRGLAILAAFTLLGLPAASFGQSAFKRGDVDGDGCVGERTSLSSSGPFLLRSPRWMSRARTPLT